MKSMIFAIKAEVSDPWAETLVFSAQKTMYGGKHIAKGHTIFVFASENEGGPGLIASGVITSAQAISKKRGIARQTPQSAGNLLTTDAEGRFALPVDDSVRRVVAAHPSGYVEA